MKNLIIKLLVVVVAITLSTNLSAKSPITIVNEIVINPITYVEILTVNATVNGSILYNNPLGMQIVSLEERDIFIQVEDDNPNQMALATVLMKSLDGSTELGPYTVTEGVILKVVVDKREWIVQLINSTEGATVKHWYCSATD